MQQIVEPPHRGRAQRARTLPTVPRHVGLSFSVDEAPIDHADIAALADGQHGVDGRTGPACRSCRKTRMLVMPMDCAQPNSLSMVEGSKLASCHISSWLMALAGT
jgi:hypothetical protein